MSLGACWRWLFALFQSIYSLYLLHIQSIHYFSSVQLGTWEQRLSPGKEIKLWNYVHGVHESLCTFCLQVLLCLCLILKPKKIMCDIILIDLKAEHLKKMLSRCKNTQSQRNLCLLLWFIELSCCDKKKFVIFLFVILHTHTLLTWKKKQWIVQIWSW